MQLRVPTAEAGSIGAMANGSARTLRDVVDYYDRRFDMKLSETEKQDLINFLGVL